MDHIRTILNEMGEHQIIIQSSKYIKSLISITCNQCHTDQTVTIEAVYRQRRRGHAHYRCRKCSGSGEWTRERRDQTSQSSKLHWVDAEYHGVITGIALANSIKRELANELDDL